MTRRRKERLAAYTARFISRVKVSWQLEEVATDTMQ